MSGSPNNGTVASLSLSPQTFRRRDIQGLRAIAVLVVVAFHAGLPIPGGFVGVDVFFVISGFVISAMLHREQISTGRIRFLQFYLKRFKRLIPALALMVTVTLIISAVVLSSFDYQQNAAKTGIGAMLLAANIVIVRTTGEYFGLAADTNPLLNTWSLSVEEQFYLVFPALIALGWYFARRNVKLRAAPFLIISAVAVLSVGLALAGSIDLTFPGAGTILGFYSPFTRAWEFAVGALLALVLAKGKAQFSSRLTSVMGLVGIGMLVASLWLITEATIFPGPWTILPVLGTLLLLLSGTSNNPVNRVLGTRPMVRIGDWSYSIYLWHWPFIVFATYLWPFSPYAAFLAAVISLAPAVASYHWVEQPIRQRVTDNRIYTIKLITFVTVPPILLAGLVGVTATFYWQPKYLSGEKPSYVLGDLFPDESARKQLQELRFPCDDADALYPIYCGQTQPGKPVQVAIIGDSHADHLFPGLVGALLDTNVAHYALPATLPIADGGDMSRLIDRVVQDAAIEIVVVNAFWAQYKIPVDELAQTLDALTQAGKKVFVTDDVPDFPFGADQCKYGLSPLLPIGRCTQGYKDFAQKYAAYYPQLEVAVNQVPGVELLNTAQYFCDLDTCSMTIDGTLVYADGNHINHRGSVYLIERLLADNAGLRNALSVG